MYYTIKEITLQGIENAIASGSKDFSTLAGIVNDMRAVPVFNNMYLVGDEKLTDMADEVRSDSGVVHIGSVEQIVVDKNNEPDLPCFYIDNKIYYFEEGMTWREWRNSEYNIDNFYWAMLGDTPIHDSYGNYVIKSNLEGDNNLTSSEWSEGKIISNEKYITCIFFYINDNNYQMFYGTPNSTWQEWINSKYNTIGVRVSGQTDYILSQDGNEIHVQNYSSPIYYYDIIENDTVYVISNVAGKD